MELLRFESLLPKQFKYIGYIAALVLLFYSLLMKFFPLIMITDKIHMVNVLFVIAMIVVIGSRSDIEDERVLQIRYYSHSMLSGLLVGFILIHEVDQNYISYLPYLSTVLSAYVIQYLYLYYYGSDWILTNKGKYQMFMILLCISLVFFYRWLWA